MTSLAVKIFDSQCLLLTRTVPNVISVHVNKHEQTNRKRDYTSTHEKSKYLAMWRVLYLLKFVPQEGKHVNTQSKSTKSNEVMMG